MANLASAGIEPVRLLIAGHPGSAKTGSLTALSDAGFKLRILDYDGNTLPLQMYGTPEGKARIDAVHLGDKLSTSGDFIEVKEPTGFKDGLRLMDQWRYDRFEGVDRVMGRPKKHFKTGETIPDDPPARGEVIDLGSSKDWGPDTVVVLDSLTAMGDTAMSKAMHLMNRTKMDNTDRVYGVAMGEQKDFLKKVRQPGNRFHFIVFAHLKMIGPQNYREGKGGDSEIMKQIKKEQSDLITTRWYPTALGRALPQEVSRLFPVQLLYENVEIHGTVRRQIWTAPRIEVDLKMPSLDISKSLPISDGLLTVFKALGAFPPNS